MAKLSPMKMEKQKPNLPALELNRVPAFVMPLALIVVVFLDISLTAISLFAAFSVREGEPILSSTAWAWSKEFVPYVGILFFAVPATLFMLAYEGLYKLKGEFSYTREAIGVLKAVAVASLLTVAFAFLFRGGFAFREFSYSRGVFLLFFAISVGAFLVVRLSLRFIQAQFRKRDINLIPTLIVGTNFEAEQTVEELKRRPELGYRVIGIIAEGEFTEESFCELPIVGEPSDLPELISQLKVQEVIITQRKIQREKLFEIMMSIPQSHRVEFRIAPSLYNVMPQKTSVEQIGVLPIVTLFREPLSDFQRFVKRTADLFISLAAIAFLSPLLIVIAALIKFGSTGKVLFKQPRVGMDGRKFDCLKFRTMYENSDESLHRRAYLENLHGNETSSDNDGKVFGKVKDDPRITGVGRYLRRWSLDELPQLFNVVLGDMSVVGPRPPIPYEVEEYEIWHRGRLNVKPGITGLWQVSGRNRLTFDEMVRADIFYIENWSVWLDLKILLLTFPAVIRGDGARDH